MNCTPDPEVNCGTTTTDTCVNVVVPWPACFPTASGPCYRQSDFNSAIGNLLCTLANAVAGPNPITIPIVLPTGVTSILSSITLSGLTGCTIGSAPFQVVIAPVGTTVFAELQNIYNVICQNLPVSLNTPLSLSGGAALSLGCFSTVCGIQISTLGQLLQALINSACQTSVGTTYTAKVCLTSAQILALNSTPIVLVQAAGVGTVIQVLAVTGSLTFNTIAYATATTLDVKIGGTTVAADSQLLPATGSLITQFSLNSSTLNSNTSVTLSAATSNPTAGNSTLCIYISYKILTL